MLARWNEYPNFSKQEFDCKHTGKNEMRHDFMVKLQSLRTAYGKPMKVTSGFRHPTHPVEAKKGHATGEHTRGMCVDIACVSSQERFDLIRLALQHGFKRIGIADNFIHLGLGGPGLPDGVIWRYI